MEDIINQNKKQITLIGVRVFQNKNTLQYSIAIPKKRLKGLRILKNIPTIRSSKTICWKQDFSIPKYVDLRIEW